MENVTMEEDKKITYNWILVDKVSKKYRGPGKPKEKPYIHPENGGEWVEWGKEIPEENYSESGELIPLYLIDGELVTK
jgi:hypothetical protein